VKERLTGAIILVALIVLLVPELLTGPVASGSSQPAAASAEEPPLRSYTINLGDDSHARGSVSTGTGTATPEPSGPAQPTPVSPSGPATITEGPTAVTATPAAPERPTPAQRPTPTQRPTPAQRPTPVPPPATAARPEARAPVPSAKANPEPAAAGDGTSKAHGSAGGWMVQLGVFASQSNADRLAQELKGKGFKVSVAEIPGNGRKLFRVRAGPVADRSAAADLQAKLRAAGAPGSVVPRT
jgi:DedD protein